MLHAQLNWLKFLCSKLYSDELRLNMSYLILNQFTYIFVYFSIEVNLILVSISTILKLIYWFSSRSIIKAPSFKVFRVKRLLKYSNEAVFSERSEKFEKQSSKFSLLAILMPFKSTAGTKTFNCTLEIHLWVYLRVPSKMFDLI